MRESGRNTFFTLIELLVTIAPMRDYLSSVNLQKNRFFKKCRLGDLKNAFVLLLFEVI